MYILLIEDDVDYRALLRQRLAAAKDRAWAPQFRVIEAGSLAEAEATLAQQAVDAILLDLMLPDSAGMASVARIQAAAPAAAIIVLTGRTEEGWIQQALQAGVQDYLFKSGVSNEALMRALRYAVERKRVEVALLTRDRRYRALVENAWDLVLVVDGDLRIQYASPAIQRSLGHVPAQLEGELFLEIIHPDDRATVALNTAGDAALAPSQSRTAELRARAADGQWRVLSVLLTNLVEDPAVQGIVINGRDVTDQRKAEDALRRSQHLQSLGLLAGGVAHDFNNLLTSIATQNTLAQAKLPAGSQARQHLEKAAKAVSMAADLTRKLLTYAGEQKPALAATNLNAVIGEYVRLLAPSLPQTTRLHLDLVGTRPIIDADVGQIQRLIMNLLVNAADALAQGAGDIWIRTGVEHVGEDDLAEFVTAVSLPPGEYVYLDVSDNGIGMDESTRRQLFEPFFTTKPEGHGLGLATVIGIVRNHRAGIRVISDPGSGAHFRVLFPPGRLASQPALPAQPVRAARRRTVLVIDDEALVVEAMADALAAAGLQTLTAERGMQGIELFRAHQDAIGAVIMDVRMPQMNGIEALQRLRQIDPEVQVILFSGYVGKEDVLPYLVAGTTEFLEKPLDFDRLLGLVTNAVHHSDLM